MYVLSHLFTLNLGDLMHTWCFSNPLFNAADVELVCIWFFGRTSTQVVTLNWAQDPTEMMKV